MTLCPNHVGNLCGLSMYRSWACSHCCCEFKCRFCCGHSQTLILKCGTLNLPASKTPQQDPSATRLLGEHGLRRQKTLNPRNGTAYIGLGVTCPNLTGYATITSLICLRPGSDSAKKSYAHVHIGCLPMFMGGGHLYTVPSCNGVCSFPQGRPRV